MSLYQPTAGITAMSSAAPALDLAPTLGAIVIGILLSVALYGVTSFQTFLYFHKYWNADKRSLKSFIAIIWLLETAHACLLCAYLWNAVVVNFSNPAALLRTRVPDDITTAVTALIIFLVHCFYAHRLWMMSESILLVGAVVFLAICHFGFEMSVVALTLKFRAFSEFHRITPYYTSAVAIAAADDIIIALSMFFLLHKRRTGIKSTETLVNKIITYTISTGFLTSIINIAILVSFVAMPNNLVYLCLYDFVNNLYANSLLAMLNVRDSLRKYRPDVDLYKTDRTTTFPPFQPAPAGNSTDQTDSTAAPVKLVPLGISDSEASKNGWSGIVSREV